MPGCAIRFVRVGSAALAAAAAVVATATPAVADEAVMHNITYSVFT